MHDSTFGMVRCVLTIRFTPASLGTRLEIKASATGLELPDLSRLKEPHLSSRKSVLPTTVAFGHGANLIERSKDLVDVICLDVEGEGFGGAFLFNVLDERGQLVAQSFMLCVEFVHHCANPVVLV